MSLETRTTRRFDDLPRDKPEGDRVEHGNLDRPGAKSHPSAPSACAWARAWAPKPDAWRLP